MNLEPGAESSASSKDFYRNTKAFAQAASLDYDGFGDKGSWPDFALFGRHFENHCGWEGGCFLYYELDP